MYFMVAKSMNSFSTQRHTDFWSLSEPDLISTGLISLLSSASAWVDIALAGRGRTCGAAVSLLVPVFIVRDK